MSSKRRSDWDTLTQFRSLVRETDVVEQLYLHEAVHSRLGRRILFDGEDITPQPLYYHDDELGDLLRPARRASESDEEPRTEPQTPPQPAQVKTSSDHQVSLDSEASSEEDSSLEEESSEVSEERKPSRRGVGPVALPLPEETMRAFLEQFPPLPAEGEALQPPTVRRYETDGDLVELAKREEPPPPPRTVTIVLAETPTQFLLELPSATCLRGTAEGDLAEEDNRRYDDLVHGEGRYRKRRSAGVQADWILWRDNATQASRIETRDVAVMATTYDLYQSSRT